MEQPISSTEFQAVNQAGAANATSIELDARPKILIADDIPANIFSLRSVLKNFDINIYEAHSGAEAISLSLSNDFFLILMDVQMPIMSGIEAAEVIHKKNINKTPIIFITAVDRDQLDIASAYEAGAVDYIVKPVDKSILRNKVQVFLDLYEQKKEIEEKKNQYEHMAAHDMLTGLLNRNQFEEHLKKSMANAKRHNFEIALLFIDLDNFKSINDTFGHSVGDLVLKKVAEILKKSLRQGDTVARLGGDEFVVILDILKDRDSAKIVTHKLLGALNKEHTLDGCLFTIEASIGVASYSSDVLITDPEQLIQLADKAMYRAKQAGGNRSASLEK